MARDYEDFSSIDDLDDDELRQLVRDRLAEHPDIDIDDITVEVSDGTVRLEGRVGSESELRIAEHVVTDLVGATDVENALVVDANRRAESPEDVEEHIAMESAAAGTMLGEMPPQESDEVDEARGDEDLDERMFGTTDVHDAIAHGTSYSPPESPTPEGIGGTDAGPGEYGEDH
ncbi:MAG: BON domain-containing protein [Gemmatirosa sp.]|nr:BON domain-containing protein [Gemmatirosa sp.]